MAASIPSPSVASRRSSSVGAMWVGGTLFSPWPTPPSPPPRAWPPSVSSCPCSRTIFDPAGLRERLSALETEMGAPGFWDDPESAAKVGAEHTRVQRRLDNFTKLQSDAEDLEGLAELAEEDPEIASELEDAIGSAGGRLGEGGGK